MSSNSCSSRFVFITVFMIFFIASISVHIVDAFILQELPLYRTERNLETAAFDRALRSNSMAFNNKRSFHQQFFFRNIPYRYYD